MNAELKITGRVIEIGNLDGGPVIGASFDRGDGRYFEITRLSEDEARALAPAYYNDVTITIGLTERATPASTIVPDLMRDWKTGAKSGDDVCVELFRHFSSTPVLGAEPAAPAAQPQPVAEHGELPPLPEPKLLHWDGIHGYEDDDMHTYARAAIAASQPPQDERAAFEVWAASRLASIHRHKAAGHDLNGSYISVSTQAAWEAWQARAAMAKGGAANCQDNEGEK